MRYDWLDEEVNPGVRFDGDSFSLKMPILKIFPETHEAEIEDIEYYVLNKAEIINNFCYLFIEVSEDIEETGECFEFYEREDEEKAITYSLYPNFEEGQFELAITYAQNIGVFEYPLYTSVYRAEDNSGEIYEQMIEDSHHFFHDDLMRIAEVYKDILL